MIEQPTESPPVFKIGKGSTSHRFRASVPPGVRAKTHARLEAANENKLAQAWLTNKACKW